MSENEKKEEIPAFKISDKRVDDSWKEEVRREREAAAAAKAAAATTAKPAAAGSAAPAPAHDDDPLAPQPSTGAAKPAASKTGGPPAPQKPAGTAAEQQATKIFMNFLAGLAQQALMQMGEIESPFSGQREMDLQGARYTIELLSVIEQRTHGNVTEDEATAMKEAIHDLRVRFVQITQEVQRQMAAQAAGGKGAPGVPGVPGGGLRPGPGGAIGGKRR